MSDRGGERQPPQAWWNNQLERRLNELHVSITTLERELREESKRGDNRQWSLNNLDERVKEIRRQVEGLEKSFRDEVVTKEDFKPYRNGIILALTTIVAGVLGALLKLVIIPH